MKRFISCDWGTSSLRLRIIDVDGANVLAETVSEQGIAATYELWKQSRKQESDKILFYQSILAGHIRKMEVQTGCSLQDWQLIISGMASSGIGMMELSYSELPFYANAHGLYVKSIEATEDCQHRTFLVSGVKTTDDVMRGEETQLIGCLDENNKGDHLFIFPGTHSKHIRVKNGEVIDIKTYMTGEFFDILSRKSILSVSVLEGANFNNKDSFEKGLLESARSNLLHNAFLVRTNDLFNKLGKQENYYYLSGLLIGTELREIVSTAYERINLVVNEGMKDLYQTALKLSGFGGQDKILEIKNADAALVSGQIKIWRNLNS